MSLAEKTRDELFEIAKKLELKPHHMLGKEKLLDLINCQQESRIEAASKPEEKAEIIVHSKDDILDALKPYLENGMSVEFPGDDTWVISCKGAEDSGHMSTPLRLIKQKAQFVVKGRRSLPSLGHDGQFGKSYAGNILAG